MKRRHPAIRFLKHLFSTAMPVRWQIHKHFSDSALTRIESAIQTSEQLHAGEIRFVVEASLHPMEILCKKTPKKRALELFAQFNIWDTAQNNGVLIYLLLADRDVEIVADRGIHQHVGNNGWDKICHAMEIEFRQGNFEQGVMQGLNAISNLLQKYYPAGSDKNNELPNKPIIL